MELRRNKCICNSKFNALLPKLTFVMPVLLFLCVYKESRMEKKVLGQIHSIVYQQSYDAVPDWVEGNWYFIYLYCMFDIWYQHRIWAQCPCSKRHPSFQISRCCPLYCMRVPFRRLVSSYHCGLFCTKCSIT